MQGPDFDPITITFVFEMVMLGGLLCVLFSDEYINRKQRRTLIVLVLMVIYQNAIFFLDIGSWPWAMAYDQLPKKLESIITYSIRPVMILMFTAFVQNRPQKTLWPSWVLVGINTALYLTALFSPIVFSYYPGGTFRRGPLGYTCHVISGLLILSLLGSLLRTARAAKRFRLTLPALNTLMLIAGVVYDLSMSGGDTRITGLGLALVGNCVFYYIWLHLEFVREHEEDLKAQQRMQIMMSQIQPHFLYNTLSTIQAMCQTDPAGAQKTVEKFSIYLRQNLESLEKTGLIPLEKELEHARIYAEIEKERFENIDVVYDIQDSRFSLPALTIQPLVENAIRHGVRIREHGLVTVSTRKADGFHEIQIQDNGQGFDPSRINNSEGKHIGLRNVRERIEKLCGGTLQIESRTEEGTTVTIRIPEQAD